MNKVKCIECGREGNIEATFVFTHYEVVEVFEYGCEEMYDEMKEYDKYNHLKTEHVCFDCIRKLDKYRGYKPSCDEDEVDLTTPLKPTLPEVTEEVLEELVDKTKLKNPRKY